MGQERVTLPLSWRCFKNCSTRATASSGIGKERESSFLVPFQNGIFFGQLFQLCLLSSGGRNQVLGAKPGLSNYGGNNRRADDNRDQNRILPLGNNPMGKSVEGGNAPKM
ncbi:MAG TPA: hypothetical protein VFN35_08650 [Ktedonobacteraceae bacterium]|nr:hypothetical protein [Ktedonobacteraceae bacterium]